MLENERHASTVALIPLDRLLTETDGPFTKIGDRIPKPSDVTGLVERLSRLYGISTVLMTATIRENLRILLASKEGLNH
jgi:TatD DNase family protein